MSTDPRYKMPAEKRKFGGKVYTYLFLSTKAEVKEDAKRWRRKGYNVRTVPWKGKYAFYIKKRAKRC